ncbi:efflux transporter outer membrane subunit [Pseudomonas sp. PDM14]|uniref:efflux transporter outer membrane subunit n=1 Tax=Pseudomonas sp. PDM14 TaxID=2769288 RepID=UPI00177CAD0E|nr:efflux transporter outer membrane subunit [Pseudomonas sp. PDM14]MBD9484066.1 efflux transporter outer membrane subunit [Pseudomonas sp. PDM14]
MTPSPLRPLFIVITTLALGACAIGPDYQRPASAPSAQFKQAAGWKAAAPADTALRGNWWELYGDAELNQLIERLNSNNQSLASAEAQFRQARALARGARAAFFPSLNLNTGVTRAGQGGGDSTISTSDGVAVSGSNASRVSKTYDASLGVSWELDVWGKLRRQLEADNASLQASAADLAAVRLSQQSELVQSYLQLRVLDEQKRLLDETVVAYQRAFKIAENQYRAGIVPRSDVTQALTQLRGTEAEAVDLEYQRAQLEHALAVLVGVAPSEFDLAARAAYIPSLPAVPLSLPSSLLERRPDIAAAERRVMSANASIGVAKAAYYPDLTLSATGGYRSGSFNDWISTPNRFWSIGPQFAMTLFDAGLISSQVEQAEASYDQTVADYRQTVLEGFREVEDYLVQLSVFEREAVVQQQALDAARESLRLILNQYKAGTVEFTDVVSVQTSALSNERTNLTLQGNRLTASVQLIAAMGGGWQAPAEE